MGDHVENKTVCVTGATGYLASWLVKLLLERGYTVKASVRDPDDPRKTEHLRELPGANERLHLFKANLLEEGAFDFVVDECIGVFHTASPCFLDIKDKDPQVEIIEPAVKGTLNVLSSCAKTPSVRRVIVTSSIAAIGYNKTPKTPGTVTDETSYSDPDFCKELKLWYPLSKTLAEKAAWKFAADHNIDMVAINPGICIGPLLQPIVNESVGFIFNLINGASTFFNASSGWVHVRDVMEAHILAFETPSANGRYCIVEKVADTADVASILRELYPEAQLPEKSTGENDLPENLKIHNYCQKKANALGVKFTPFEVSLKETVESLKDMNLVKF
ncbi:Coumarine and phenylpropanoid biosynthesis [Ranunculus cassubicifolius]